MVVVHVPVVSAYLKESGPGCQTITPSDTGRQGLRDYRSHVPKGEWLNHSLQKERDQGIADLGQCQAGRLFGPSSELHVPLPGLSMRVPPSISEFLQGCEHCQKQEIILSLCQAVSAPCQPNVSGRHGPMLLPFLGNLG